MVGGAVKSGLESSCFGSGDREPCVVVRVRNRGCHRAFMQLAVIALLRHHCL
jgi:hypothetical protein